MRSVNLIAEITSALSEIGLNVKDARAAVKANSCPKATPHGKTDFPQAIDAGIWQSHSLMLGELLMIFAVEANL